MNKLLLKQSANYDKGFIKPAKIEDSFFPYEGKNYKIVGKMLSSAGFKTIEYIPLEDLSKIKSFMDGKTKTILVNGEPLERDDAYLTNETVSIYYHSKRSN